MEWIEKPLEKDCFPPCVCFCSVLAPNPTHFFVFVHFFAIERERKTRVKTTVGMWSSWGIQCICFSCESWQKFLISQTPNQLKCYVDRNDAYICYVCFLLASFFIPASIFDWFQASLLRTLLVLPLPLLLSFSNLKKIIQIHVYRHTIYVKCHWLDCNVGNFRNFLPVWFWLRVFFFFFFFDSILALLLYFMNPKRCCAQHTQNTPKLYTYAYSTYHICTCTSRTFLWHFRNSYQFVWNNGTLHIQFCERLIWICSHWRMHTIHLT